VGLGSKQASQIFPQDSSQYYVDKINNLERKLDALAADVLYYKKQAEMKDDFMNDFGLSLGNEESPRMERKK